MPSSPRPQFTGTRYIAYIDESGDEGFKWPHGQSGSTPWFFMVAAVVKKQDDLDAAGCVDRIKQRLGTPPGRPLHWAKLRSHRQRKVIIQEIAREPITLICVGVDKTALTNTAKLKKPPALYLYTARFLLERVSWLVSEAGARVDCVFENRTSLSYPVLTAYIKSLAANPSAEIRPVIDAIVPLNRDQRKMLQVADACAGACLAAFSKDKFGNVEPSYLLGLEDHLYRRGGNLFSYGLKLFPKGADKLMTEEDTYNWLANL